MAETTNLDTQRRGHLLKVLSAAAVQLLTALLAILFFVQRDDRIPNHFI